MASARHSFANTGNIEILRGGQRVLVGQYAEGEFRIKKEFQSDGPAQNRIQTCLEAVARYGKPAPRIVLV
jgi:hypothetical protein